MQTEINGTFHSMKNSSLNFRKLTNGTAFSEIYEFKGRFPFDQIKISVWISWNFHGRMVQTFPVWKTTSRTALFAWNFSMISRFKSQTEHWYVDIVTFYTPQQHWPVYKPRQPQNGSLLTVTKQRVLKWVVQWFCTRHRSLYISISIQLFPKGCSCDPWCMIHVS